MLAGSLGTFPFPSLSYTALCLGAWALGTCFILVPVLGGRVSLPAAMADLSDNAGFSGGRGSGVQGTREEERPGVAKGEESQG